MTRREKRVLAARKRQEIVSQIAELVLHTIEKGKTAAEAIAETDRWCRRMISESPQQKSLYKDAAREYGIALEELTAAMEE